MNDGTHQQNVGAAWRLKHALLLTVCLSLQFIIHRLFIVPLLGLDMESALLGSPRALLGLALGAVYSLGLVVGVGLFWLGRMGPAQVGWKGFRLGRDLGLGLLLGLAMCLLTVCLLVAAGASLSDIVEQLSSFTAGQRLEAFLIGLIAALSEETLFRGYLQPQLVARLGLRMGIGAGAVVFALYHLPFSPHPLGLAVKFAFGLMLGALRGRDRSLLAPITAHFAYWQILGFL